MRDSVVLACVLIGVQLPLASGVDGMLGFVLFWESSEVAEGPSSMMRNSSRAFLISPSYSFAELFVFKPALLDTTFAPCR